MTSAVVTSYIVIVEVLVAKSRSNIDFKAVLLETGDKFIVESTKDYIIYVVLVYPLFHQHKQCFPWYQHIRGSLDGVITVIYTAG